MPLRATDHVVVEIEKIAKDKRYDGYVKNGRRIKGFDCRSDNTVQGKIGNGGYPKKRVDKKRSDFAADHELKNDGVYPVGLDKFERVSHVNQISLHVTLNPA